jgi:limonene-1,2-epoxide hydrolase
LRGIFALGAALVVAAAGSGAAQATGSPEQVVRAWSTALNANRNEDAAKLFAPHARVIQPGVDVLLTHKLAVLFNSSLPCGGTITRLQHVTGGLVATFVLGERPKHRCDGPGLKAATYFVVVGGKIVLWEQVAVPSAPKKPQPPGA